VIRASFDTPRFSFEAFAASKEEALKLLTLAWAEHAESYMADPNYLEEYIDDVYFTTIRKGLVLRDNDPIIKPLNQGATHGTRYVSDP
jgi:hypothetical protein